MGRKLDFSCLSALFENGEDFQLTDAQYEARVGKALPRDVYYIEKKSPLAKVAQENGYELQVEENAVIQRVVTFRKVENQ